MEFEYDQKNTLYVRIDRKRKFLGTIFLRALGLRTDEEILKTFYTVDTIHVKDGKLYWKVAPEAQSTNLLGTRPALGITVKGEELAPATRKISPHTLKLLRSHKIESVEVETSEFDGAMTASDVVDLTTGELLYEANQELTADKLHKVLQAGVTSIEVFFPERDDVGNIITNTLRRDTVRKPEEALIEIYRKLRPGDPPTLDTASALFEGMFFDQRKYDFSRVGRLKFNIKLYENQDASGLDKRTLTPEDFYGTIRYLLKLRKNIGMVDDIDHLGNRRVRAVGELMENQFRIGLVRMERAIKEKMSVYQEMSTAMPHDLINAKPVMAAIREFFGSSQLSQFMDQTNPLSEITHKRRLSALGPGGLSRERAGFEVRDVHPTHYGRICPIETPEGPNIGLISSLSCFARINEYGFIESPYRRVKDGRVLDFFAVVNAGESSLRQGDHIEANELRRLNERLRKEKKRQVEVEPYSFYLSAWEEDRHTVAQANIELDEKGNIVQNIVDARRQGNFVMVNKPEVDYVDVSPKQLVSVAASLVPFLEHDDANRALMGANMQRQSVPLLVSEAPYVGTGMEGVTARDSGAVILAKRNGIVDSVDSERIIVRVEGEHHPTQLSREVGSDIYQLTKFKRSNQNTCINQKPIVSQGDRVVKGQVIADGPCTEQGELGLGRNVLVAFMPWRGYNFEDAILISEKLVKDDYYTSIHIEEFEIEARDTKLGPEEITRDIPNVSEHALRDLDDSGIIRIGASVGHNDILVGKVTPKGETQLTPEEKLLRAIFGEKAGDVRDASLTCPPGIEGTIVDVRIFSRKGQEKDERAKQIEQEQIEKLERNLADEIRILTDERLKRLEGILGAREVLSDLHDERTNKKLLSQGRHSRPRHHRADQHAQPQAHSLCGQGPAGERADRRDRGDDLSPDRCAAQDHQRQGRQDAEGRRAFARRHQDGEGVRRHEAQALGGRQDGGTARQQGRDRAHPARGGHAVPARWNAGGDCAEPAGRAFANERGADSGDPPGLGGARTGQADRRGRRRDGVGQRGARTLQGALCGHRRAQPASGPGRRADHPRRRRNEARHLVRHRGLRRSARDGDQGAAEGGGTAQLGQDAALRRHGRRAVRAARDGRLHLYAEALAPGGRQDPRALHRAVQPDYATAAGRQGAVRRTALRRDGGVGAGGIRRGLHPAGAAHRKIRRCLRPHQDLRGHCEGRGGNRARRARIVQRTDPRVAVAVPRRRADQADRPEEGTAA